MSAWEDGTPCWAPTRAEIQTWEAPDAGVIRGRGFVPAGRGRGIAKWSTTQGDKPVGPNKPGIAASLDRRDSKSRREPGGPSRLKEAGGRLNNESKGSEIPECYREPRDRPPPLDPEPRLRDEGRGARNPDKSRGPRNGELGGRAGYRDVDRVPANSFECYKCNGVGHIARNCTVRDRTEDHRTREGRSRVEEHSRNTSGRTSDECYSCGGAGHLARHCTKERNGAGPQHYVPEEEEAEEELFQHGVSSGINFSKYENIDVKVTGGDVVEKIHSFETANLHPVLIKNLVRSNYSMPTPVQKHAIPNIIDGRDLMACAQTGSGKTAAFLIPVIHLLLERGVVSQRVRGVQCPQVIVVSPTRELAIQIKDEARRFSACSCLTAVVAYGGTSVSHQADKIREGCNILIATPGRLLDFVNCNIVGLAGVRFLVLDEADRMLDMNFKDDILKLVRNPDMPSKKDRQTLMFSATFPDPIQRMAAEFMQDYLFLTVGIVGGACRDVTQSFYQVSQYEKREKLLEVVQNIYDSSTKKCKCLVFVEMKKTADFIASYMCQSGFPTTSIHGDREQKEREEAIEDFKHGRKSVLIATKVAARGLDIKNVEMVINYDLPKSIDEYVHRIGRTGRLGNTGCAISFYDVVSDSALSADLVKVLSDAQQTVPEWLLAEARRNPNGFHGTVGRNYGSKDVRAVRGQSRERDSYYP